MTRSSFFIIIISSLKMVQRTGYGDVDTTDINFLLLT